MNNIDSCTRCGKKLIGEEFETHECKMLPKFIGYARSCWGGNVPESWKGLRLYGICEDGRMIPLPTKFKQPFKTTGDQTEPIVQSKKIYG